MKPTTAALLSMLAGSTLLAGEHREATCEGAYPKHLQGVCVDDQAIYWSFTTELVKTDLDGKLIKKVPADDHHGDLCHRDGKIYVAVNLGKFNDPKGNADSWVYVYNAEDLSLIAKRETPEVFHGAGGIDHRDGHFFVVGGLPNDVAENYVYEYNGDFQFIKKHIVPSGHTHLGIQTAAFADGRWWFGCYGSPAVLLVADTDFNMIGRHQFDCALGIVGLPDGRFLVAKGGVDKEKRHTGALKFAVPDDAAGLRFLK